MPPRRKRKPTKKLADLIKEFRISPPSTTLGTPNDKTESKSTTKPDTQVPPIFLHQSVDLKDHVQTLLKSGVNFFQPYKGRFYTKVKCLSFEDHSNFIHFLKLNKLPYHTYGHPNDKKNKFVIRGLPNNTCLNVLKSELESMKIPVLRIQKMHTKVTSKEHPLLVLVIVDCDGSLKLKEVDSLLGNKVKIESPITKTKQCHRCQKWGHSQRYCHGQIRCVKCAEEHWTSECLKDPKDPPKCANCGEGHTANYKACNHCPESCAYKYLQKRKPKNVKQDKHKLVTLLNYQDELYKNKMSPAQLKQDLPDTEVDYNQQLY